MRVTDGQRQPRVSWFEVFYDLVLVAAVLHGSHLFEESPSFAKGVWLSVTLLVLLTLWLLTTLTFNTLRKDWNLRRLLTLAQMMALVIASLSISRTSGLSDSTGLVALAAAFGCVSILYWLEARGASPAPRGPRLIAISTTMAVVVCLIGALFPESDAPLFVNPASIALCIAVALALVPMFTAYLGSLAKTGALDRDHLAERMGQLVIIALGESFADLIISLGDFDSIPNPVYLVLTFVVIYALWAIYFRTVLPAGIPKSPGRVRGWIASHYLLLFGAIGTAAGLSALTVLPFDDTAVALASFRLPLPLLYVMIAFLLLTWIAGIPDRRFLWVHVAAGALLLALTVAGATVFTDRALTTGVAAAAVVIADAAVSAWLGTRPAVS